MNNSEKPKISRPWSKEMYEWNDKVSDQMKTEIKIQMAIALITTDWDKLNELVSLCGGVKYGDGFTIQNLYNGCINELERVQNYWLNEEWEYAVSRGIVSDCIKIDFIGY